MRIAIVGAGRMGTVLARIGRYFGDELVGVVEADREAARRFERLTGIRTVCSVENILGAEVIFLTVGDDAIEVVSRDLSEFSGIVLHCSGARASDILHGGRARGSMHPLMACPLGEVSDVACVGTYCGVLHCVEGDGDAVLAARAWVTRLGGKVVEISTRDKAVYHAAAVFASNYPIVLMETALSLFSSCGISLPDAKEGCLRMMSQALESMKGVSPVEALTGPVKRHDCETIARHREALKDYGDILPLYDALLAGAKKMCGWEN